MGAFDGYLRQIEEFNRLAKPLFDMEADVRLKLEAQSKRLRELQGDAHAALNSKRIQELILQLEPSEQFKAAMKAASDLAPIQKSFDDILGMPAARAALESIRQMEEMYAKLDIRPLEIPPLPEPPYPKKFADPMPKPREPGPKPFIGFVNTNSVACAHCGQSVPYTAHRCSSCGAPRIQ
jgi:hypothetical protein